MNRWCGRKMYRRGKVHRREPAGKATRCTCVRACRGGKLNPEDRRNPACRRRPDTSRRGRAFRHFGWTGWIMPIYEFEAVDPGAITVSVRVAAADVHEALRKVEQRGYFMASLAESEAAGNGHAGRRKRRRAPRAIPFTTVRSAPVSEAGRVFARPAH